MTAPDLGNNFLLQATDVGRLRSQAVCELLGELNEDVDGKFVEEDLTTLLTREPEFFKSFTLVIATQITEDTLARLGR